MAFALWLVGGFFALVFFGTWALQIALWLLALALRLAAGLAVVLFSLASILALAFLDRKQLARLWRNARPRWRDPVGPGAMDLISLGDSASGFQREIDWRSRAAHRYRSDPAG